MIEIRKSDIYKTKSDLTNAINLAKSAYKDWKAKTGVPALIFPSEIQKVLDGESYTYIPKTELEEAKEKSDIEVQLLIDEKLLAETTPSSKYAEFRQAEYPNLLDFIDAQVKKQSEDTSVQAEGVIQEATYLDACNAVKLKYPKPA
jgi:hypothetical protein